MKQKPTEEQEKVLKNDKKNLIVSASAGSGKTFVVIEYLINLICEKKVPLSKMLVLTFTKAAANEMRTRLTKAILEQKPDKFLLEQIDEISISDISTIDAFCEKFIKRNANILNIDENFTVFDEKSGKNLKLISFNKVINQLAQENDPYFNELYFAFKKSKERIFDAVDYFYTYFSSQSDSEKFIEDFIKNGEIYLQKAIDYLFNYVEIEVQKVKDLILQTDDKLLPDYYLEFKNNLLGFCQIEMTEDIYSSFAKLSRYDILPQPRKKIEDKNQKKLLAKAKEIIGKIKKLAQNYQWTNAVLIEKSQDNYLANAFIMLLNKFSQEYKRLKEIKQGLDFADLEDYASKLLKNENVKKDMEQRYDYIFIDEYQDTNTLQEGIVKAIAQSGNFVAVGDIKQGIYGFRNASMDIMKKDIENFNNSPDGQALYLKGNFRSDNRILTFVNDIFEKIMTEESVGIDYKNTSVLEGLNTFEKDENKSVIVDMVSIPQSKAEKLQGVYSVKDDELTISKEYLNEVKTICSRVEQMLGSQIYDIKRKQMRKVQEGDIAILFRERNKVMQELVRYMQEKGFNILADIKESLTDDGQIQLLLSLLRLTIDLDDDINLVSVLNSWIGRFSLDELNNLRLNNPNSSFFEIINSLKYNDEKVHEFFETLENFSFEMQVLGISRAVRNLFAKMNYDIYLNNMPYSNNKKVHIEEFFRIIKSGDFEYNPQGLLNYFNSIKINGKLSDEAGNAIILTTIHASKGLEYPIVILAGAGESLGKSHINPYNVTSEFGIGSFLYDYEENVKIPSPIFLANKEFKKRKEFIDEIMLFYVALTRAQNHLIIVGSKKEGDINLSSNVFENKCYLDMIFSSLGENFFERVKSQNHVETENREFNLITQIEEDETEVLQELKNYQNTLNIDENKVFEYLNFKYNDLENCFYEYKNSVTGLLEKESQDNYENYKLIKQEDENIFISRQLAINEGNAYHEAIKVLDFDKINSLQDLLNLQTDLKSQMTQGNFELLDLQLLYKNISVIKQIVKNSKLFKEKQFIMQTTLKEIGVADSDNKVIVQGIVDLFSMGEKNILIDYKYSSLNEERLIKKYKTQIKLYSLACEKGFSVKIDKTYLLSLKNAKLIELTKNN